MKLTVALAKYVFMHIMNREGVVAQRLRQKYRFFRHIGCVTCNVNTPGRRQSKALSTIDESGSKSIETVFSIVICRQCGDKWQSKTLFITICDLRSSIVLTFSIAAYPVP